MICSHVHNVYVYIMHAGLLKIAYECDDPHLSKKMIDHVMRAVYGRDRPCPYHH